MNTVTARCLIFGVLLCGIVVAQGDRELSPSLTEQTRDALARDAWRRELRFIEAVDPGRTFRSTRIDAKTATVDELFEAGRKLFTLTYTGPLGFGAADLPTLSRVHHGRRGGPDAHACYHCHSVGGPAGAGDAVSNAYLDGDGSTQASALARNPVSLSGAGVLEILAAEMTAELAVQREQLVDKATRQEHETRAELTTKGVSFGVLTAHPDGTVDAAEIEGIDDDLVVRPFGWKGSFARLRDVIEDELLIHHGMQSSSLASHGARERVGLHRRPDPDGDGVVDEISDDQLDALTAYVAMQEIPQIKPPQQPLVEVTSWARGRQQFDELECSSCHRVSLPLGSTGFELAGRTIDLARDGAAPRLTPSATDETFRAYLFSDLRRHDMGPALAESRPDRGVASELFLTPPLWGLARSRPYLHDGRAATIEEAILLHGGEARDSRDRFAALSEPERAPLRVFLVSLTRERRVVSP